MLARSRADVTPTDGFARALARLDPEAFAAFVAAAYGARPDVDGVEVDGGCLVVRGREERRLRLVADRGWLRGPGPVGPATGPVDAVVTQVDGAGRRTAVGHDARLVGPADLRDRVCYGLTRADADRVLDEHLGIDRAAAVDTGGRRPPVAGGLAVVLAVAVVAGVLGTAAAGSPVVPETTTPAPAGDAAAVTESGPAAGLPAGLSPVGVTSAAALARAHEATLDGRYAVAVEARNAPALSGSGEWKKLKANGVVAGPQRYRGSVGGVRVTEDERWWRLSRLYADGERLYERRYGAYAPVHDVRAAPAHPPMDRGPSDLRRYLAVRSSPGGNVTPAEVDGEWGHRVSVGRAPPGVDGESYLAVARLTEAGRVTTLDVSYDRPDGERVSLELRYERTDEAVRAPTWLDEARRAENGTSGTLEPGGARETD